MGRFGVSVCSTAVLKAIPYYQSCLPYHLQIVGKLNAGLGATVSPIVVNTIQRSREKAAVQSDHLTKSVAAEKISLFNFSYLVIHDSLHICCGYLLKIGVGAFVSAISVETIQMARMITIPNIDSFTASAVIEVNLTARFGSAPKYGVMCLLQFFDRFHMHPPIG